MTEAFYDQVPNVNIVTPAQIATFLQLPLSTIYKLARERKMPGHRVGKHWRFMIDEIEQWLIDGEPALPPLGEGKK